MKLSHFFIPHPDTHKKAHLISWKALVVYILIFVLMQGAFKFIAVAHPGVLGIATNISQPRLIELTNVERGKLGLPALTENAALDAAAAAKAQNMFEENYWAHYSPSGKDPWGFISGAGYKFSVAGENLAKNFQNSEDVVTAWMNSPSHRDNIVHSKYKEIGIAVVNGTLNGEETTLVVQMFGTPVGEYVASNPAPTTAPSEAPAVIAQILPTGTPVSLPTSEPTVAPTEVPSPTIVATPVQATIAPAVAAASTNPPTKVLINPFQVSKSYGLSIISLLIFLLMLDLYIMRRRGVFRITSHHVAHLSVLSVAGGTLLVAKQGEITQTAVTIVNSVVGKF